MVDRATEMDDRIQTQESGVQSETRVVSLRPTDEKERWGYRL